MFKKLQLLRLLTWAFVICLLTSSSPVAFAQSSSTLQGSVTDQTGAVMAGAKIVTRNRTNGIEPTTQTDSSGNYQIAALPVGSYRVEVQAQGFQTAIL